MSALERRILAAHDSGDGAALVTLYEEAAAGAASGAASAFFLTQAWVWALEAGDPAEARLRQLLVNLGRI